MANLVNLYAEAGANVIGDDAQPTLTLENSSTGEALRVTTASASNSAFAVTKSAVGSQTIGILKIIGASVASGAAIEFSNKSFISITSTVLTTVANTDYAIPVQVGLETRYIPVFKAAALVGGAAF